MKTALIFGAYSQAAYYLLPLLNSKGYDVTVLSRTDCNVVSGYQVEAMLEKFAPDEVYNLAARMFVPSSWDNPSDYLETNALAVANMLKWYSLVRPDGRFFQAGSADVFDQMYPMSEETPIRPRSPYGISKAMAQELVRVYREEKGMFACTGILFNFESPRRPDTFFSMKVAKAVARMAAGLQDKLELGRLDAVRDWGLAEEYVEAMWLMLQSNEPKDYVIGTGVARSCLKFVEQAFTIAGLSMDRLVYDKSESIDKDVLWSDPRKIYEELGWKAKSLFTDVVHTLVESEMEKLGQSVNAVRSV